VGTGKTTLLNAALDRLDQTTKVAFIFNTDVTFEQMLNVALYEWGLVRSQQNLSKVNAIQRLNEFAIDQLSCGGNVVLIVDEAQNLDNTVMENLRLLSNLETRRTKLVQIVLSGQPELETKLDRNELRQLAQRINLRRSIYPLDENHTYKYLAHRLKIAKHSGSSPFTSRARRMIWEYSGGIPRKINMLCDNAFLIGYGLKQKKINADMVQEAARDLKWRRTSDSTASSHAPAAKTTGFTFVESRAPLRKLSLVVCTFLVGCLIFAGGFFLGHLRFELNRSDGFASSMKAGEQTTVRLDPKKDQAQLPISDSAEQANIVPKMVNKSVSQPAVAPEASSEDMAKQASPTTIPSGHTQEITKKASPKTIPPGQTQEIIREVGPIAPVPPVQTEKSIFRDVPKNDVQLKIYAQDPDKTEPVLTKSPVQDSGKSDRIVPVKEHEEIPMIVVNKGDTLSEIIIKKYGDYDVMTLIKVLRKNPQVVDPDRIFAGQVIKLPMDK